MILRTIAALYVDKGGPYYQMSGVQCWDETRDARLYAGLHPVVAHPPCGPWGNMSHQCWLQDKTLAPIAVGQVQKYGGVLEHPLGSKLWAHSKLPRPGEGLDAHGGHTLVVDQCEWGHACRKRTWLYVVRCKGAWLAPFPGKKPTHSVQGGRKEKLPGASKEVRRLTPPLFAQWACIDC